MIWEIIKDWYRNIVYVFQSNLRIYANILNTILPYLMYFIGQSMFQKRGVFKIGGELFIPIAFCVLIYFIRSYANKIGKGTTIPIPHKRFTEVDENDEVSVEHGRIQELLLYTADLEDYLERKGLL